MQSAPGAEYTSRYIPYIYIWYIYIPVYTYIYIYIYIIRSYVYRPVIPGHIQDIYQIIRYSAELLIFCPSGVCVRAVHACTFFSVTFKKHTRARSLCLVHRWERACGIHCGFERSVATSERSYYQW